MIPKRAVVLVAVAVVATVLAAAPAVDASTPTCESALRQQIASSNVEVPQSLIDNVCMQLEQISPGAIPSVGGVALALGFSSDKIPWSVKGICVFGGVITGTNDAAYVFAGEALAVGPAAATRITCTLSGGGNGSSSLALPGPAAATAGVDLLGSLSPTQVCATAYALFITGKDATGDGCSL